MPRKVFVGGEILTAADVNTNLMDQAVMVFADDTARTSAIPSPTEGMVTYLSDDDVVEVFDGSVFKAVGPGKILQVLSTTKDDTFSTSSTTFVDVTSFSVSITPSSTSSKIMVVVSAYAGSQPGTVASHGRLMRNSTAICVGAAASTRTQVSAEGISSDTSHTQSFTINFLDSPNTTSATTYKMQMRANNANSVHLNRSHTDSDGAGSFRAASTITVMEVAG